MRAWGGLWRQCQFCAHRPAVWQTGRGFGSTALLERKQTSASKRKTAKPSSGGPAQSPAAVPKWATRQRARVQTVNSDAFPELVTDTLLTLEDGLRRDEAHGKHFDGYREKLAAIGSRGFHRGQGSGQDFRLKESVREGYIKNGQAGLVTALEAGFRNYAYDVEFSTDIESQENLVDYRYPTEWYPSARAIQRRIHLHVGPTNSGKTYHALKKLEGAKSGFYAGPLRLLAHEVYSRFNAKGISCGLITGDEVKVDEDKPPAIYSNTVEMVTLGKEIDVGVIDEIQMIADPARGWAWTRALLGCQAHELHVCGEERVVPLIRDLVGSMGDTLEVHRYERLNPLLPMKTSLKGQFQRLQKGDCVVAFSRITIHALKQQIEQTTGRRAAIVYGSLPAEIRSQQADLFNDPNNDYDFLVASDAIGMGLNLSVKRIIFESVVRRTPTGLERLSIPHVKQIGGRAGRYRPAMQSADHADNDSNDNVGYVTALEEVDLPYIRQALNADPEPIKAAGLLPADHMIHNFANHFPPEVPFGYVMNRMEDLSKTNSSYFLCTKDGDELFSSMLDRIDNMIVQDKLIFLKAPLSTRDPNMPNVIRAYCRCVAEHKSGSLLEIPELRLDILDQPVSSDKEYLRSLESLHRAIVLYLWLSFRCGGIFTDRTLATHVKDLVEMKMDRALTEFSANSSLQQASSLRRQLALMHQMQGNVSPDDEASLDSAAEAEDALEELEDAPDPPKHTSLQNRWSTASGVTG